jgi:hypothetical protein
MEQIGPLQSPAATAALATLLAYGEVAYGPQHLPLLLAKYGRLHTWDSLTETVYGVNAADFETGWQHRLAEHDQTPLPRP